MLLLDRGNIGKIDTGKGVVALGALLPGAGTQNHLAVKDQTHPVGPLRRGVEEAVVQVEPGVGVLQTDGLLGAGDHDGLLRVLNEVGQGGGE